MMTQMNCLKCEIFSSIDSMYDFALNFGEIVKNIEKYSEVAESNYVDRYNSN